MTLISRALLSASLLLATVAEAQVRFPTSADLHGFRTVCAGGEVKKNSATLEAALRTWRFSPAANANVETATREVGAVLENVKGDVPSAVYTTYAACVQNLILNFLNRMNPAPRTP